MTTITHTQIMNHPEFARLLDELTAKAIATLPEHEERLHKAAELVRNGHIVPEKDATDGKHFLVLSSDSEHTYRTNGTCECADFQYRKEINGLCKHRLGTHLYRRLAQNLPPVQDEPEAPQDEPEAPVQAPPAPLTIPTEFLVKIQGRLFIKAAGLLHLAHQRGVQSIQTTFVSISSDLAVAQSTVVMANGQTFTDVADSTPSNVGPMVKGSWPRLASTRATARALRLALDIHYCSLEELDGDA